MRSPSKTLLVMGASLLVWACARHDVRSRDLLTGAALEFPKVIHPDGNEFTQERWELGKRLFFDPVLSIDSSLSCGTCHKPALAFSDSVAFSPGVHGRPGTRNAPSLANVAFHPYFLREGGVPTLEMQVLVPIQEHNEFAHNIVDIAAQLQHREDLVRLSQAAYGRGPDAFTITRSLGVFERSLISDRSAFDRYLQGDRRAMTAAQQRGMSLFFSDRSACTTCHSGPNFTSYRFEHNAQDTTGGDVGRMRVTNDSADRFLFKVPSLRNVALTSPYMHDGRYKNLEEVVAHYSAGGQRNGYQKEGKIKPLALSRAQQTDLVEFLSALSDTAFVNDPRWK